MNTTLPVVLGRLRGKHSHSIPITCTNIYILTILESRVNIYSLQVSYNHSGCDIHRVRLVHNSCKTADIVSVKPMTRNNRQRLDYYVNVRTPKAQILFSRLIFSV